MADRVAAGLLDTSVVIDLRAIEPENLPLEVAVSAITLAELAAGPAAASDEIERGRRQDRIQRAEATFDPLPFDVEAARAYGRVFAGRHRLRASTAESCRPPIDRRNLRGQ